MKILEQNVLKTKVMDWNAAWYGVEIYDWMDRAGFGIAKTLSAKFKTKSAKLKIGIFCGTGNNGGDGFAAAKYLHSKYEVRVFLFGSPLKINTKESQKTWDEMLGKGINAQVIENSADLKSVDKSFDIVIDCLLGTGTRGKLREPIASGVRFYNSLKAKKVSVDYPTKGVVKADLIISMQFAKTKNAEVVDLQSDSKFLSKIGWGEFKALDFPGPDAKKGDVGNLLLISGHEEYHGAMLYALKAASRIVDIIYVHTSAENQKIVNKLKSKTSEFVAVEDWRKVLSKVEIILIGPGLGRSQKAYDLVKKVLKTKKKVVLDADAISLIDNKVITLLRSKVIMTPHRKEFERAFKQKPSEKSLQEVSRKYGCTVVLKGKVDVVANPDWELKYNYTGNSGMAKGGTGDVLAGLTAAFYCLTDDPYLAAATGVFVNGLAGDELFEKVGHFYDAEDLVKQLPKTLVRLTKL